VSGEAAGRGRPLLTVAELRVEFSTQQGMICAVADAGLHIDRGEVLAVVGESGSGKTVTSLAILGLLPPAGRVARGKITFDSTDLLSASRKAMRKLRGQRIGMIFQDPMTALNPVMRVGDQIDEAIRIHDRTTSRAAARSRTIQTLELVGVSDAQRRARQYPHEWSGGMRQRAVIAMALANGPDLIIADEPTTALDTTVQAQVLEVLQKARAETGVAIMLITHNLGLVAEIADRVVVMYAGRVVESAPVRTVLRSSAHPYTRGLIASRPGAIGSDHRLTPIQGVPPSALAIPAGCSFHPRCPQTAGDSACSSLLPRLALVGDSHEAACHHSAAVLADAGGVPQ
jgi:oligopeptide/dipeptide ABC transporter ATP-binding protein